MKLQVANPGHIVVDQGGVVAVSTGAVAAVEHPGFDALVIQHLTGMEHDGVGNGDGCDGGNGAGLGTVGALILGTGMSLCMTELGAALGQPAMVIGILVGVVGLVMVALAYPLYNAVLRKERRRIAPEILRLSEELLR